MRRALRGLSPKGPLREREPGAGGAAGAPRLTPAAALARSREAGTGAGGEGGQESEDPLSRSRARGGCTHRQGRRRTGRGAGKSPDEWRATGRWLRRHLRASAGFAEQPAPNSCALRPAATHGGRLKRQALGRFVPCGERRLVTAPPRPGGTVAFVPGPLGRA